MFKYKLNISTLVEQGSIVRTLRDFLHTQKNYSTIYEKSEAKKFRIFFMLHFYKMDDFTRTSEKVKHQFNELKMCNK